MVMPRARFHRIGCRGTRRRGPHGPVCAWCQWRTAVPRTAWSCRRPHAPRFPLRSASPKSPFRAQCASCHPEHATVHGVDETAHTQHHDKRQYNPAPMRKQLAQWHARAGAAGAPPRAAAGQSHTTRTPSSDTAGPRSRRGTARTACRARRWRAHGGGLPHWECRGLTYGDFPQIHAAQQVAWHLP